MPESKVRKKTAYTPPPRKRSGPKTSPRWFAPLMVALFLVGLVWIVTYYISEGRFPIEAIGVWNLVVGFGVILTGFGMSTRWR